jgi:hypothetical protein
MNVEIGAEAALFPEKEYISGIFVAVHTAILENRKIQIENCAESNKPGLFQERGLLFCGVLKKGFEPAMATGGGGGTLVHHGSL